MFSHLGFDEDIMFFGEQRSEVKKIRTKRSFKCWQIKCTQIDNETKTKPMAKTLVPVGKDCIISGSQRMRFILGWSQYWTLSNLLRGAIKVRHNEQPFERSDKGETH